MQQAEFQHKIVHLLQQLVTVYRPATQPYTVALTTGYSIPAGYRLHSLVQLRQLLRQCTDQVPATQPALNSSLHISQLPAFLPFQPALRVTNPKVSYQLTTPHQQPIHRPKPDVGPNNV